MSRKQPEKKLSEFEQYTVFKTVIYLVAGFMALFIATCTGGCTVDAIASGEHKDLSYIVWTIVFGCVAYFCLSGFSESKTIVEKAMKGEVDEEVES